MEKVIPVFIIIPLAASFLISILGKRIRGFNKVISVLIFLSTLILAFKYLLSGNHASMIYKIGGWEPVNNIPIGIYLLLD